MKRKISIFLSLLTALSLFCSCKNGGSTDSTSFDSSTSEEPTPTVTQTISETEGYDFSVQLVYNCY